MKSEDRHKPRRVRRPRERDAERVFEGLGVSPGIGIGQVHVVETGAITISEYEIAEDSDKLSNISVGGAMSSGWSHPVTVHYWGGYNLPLKHHCH